MFVKTLFLAAVAAAAPAQIEDRTVNCKAIDFVVAALRIAPGASKYCSSVVSIKTSTVQTTSTATVTITRYVILWKMKCAQVE